MAREIFIAWDELDDAVREYRATKDHGPYATRRLDAVDELEKRWVIFAELVQRASPSNGEVR